tara:strand:+ start:173 stop:505 length:333 start_codon:yes stop_codon:yes gene_type:complete
MGMHYKWTPHKLKFIAMNGNISDLALAGLLGTTKASVQGQRYKLGIKNIMGQRAKNYGIPGLKFCYHHNTFKVVIGRKYIGGSSNFEEAVKVLDGYNMAVREGYLNPDFN